MHFSTAMERVREAFPGAVADADNYGQIIIYTGATLGDGGNVVEIEIKD